MITSLMSTLILALAFLFISTTGAFSHAGGLAAGPNSDSSGSFLAVAADNTQVLVAVVDSVAVAPNPYGLFKLNLKSKQIDRYQLPRELASQDILGLHLVKSIAVVISQALDQPQSDPSMALLDLATNTFSNIHVVTGCSSFKTLQLRPTAIAFDCETVTEQGTYKNQAREIKFVGTKLELTGPQQLTLPSREYSAGKLKVSLVGQWPNLKTLRVTSADGKSKDYTPGDFLHSRPQ